MMDGCLKNFVEIKAAPQTKIKPKARDVRLDALRGLFLLVMAGVHVPTPVSRLMQDPVGYNGSAEGFIFLSACLAGIVYGRTYWQGDWKAMASRMWKRSRQIYIVHVAILIPIAVIVWVLAARLPPLANHFSDFLIHPWGSLALIPLLLHQPPLFDILPLYIIFLAASPWLMGLAPAGMGTGRGALGPGLAGRTIEIGRAAGGRSGAVAAVSMGRIRFMGLAIFMGLRSGIGRNFTAAAARQIQIPMGGSAGGGAGAAGVSDAVELLAPSLVGPGPLSLDG